MEVQGKEALLWCGGTTGGCHLLSSENYFPVLWLPTPWHPEEVPFLTCVQPPLLWSVSERLLDENASELCVLSIPL